MANTTARRRRSHQRPYIEQARRRSNKRRIGLIAVIAVVVVAIAALAGFLAFRGSVGSEMALRDSDASNALVAVHSES